MSPGTDVCPADGDRLVALLVGWGCDREPSGRWLAGRADRMRRLRAAARVADGERYGWLTVAALHAGLTAAASLAVDPTAVALDERVGAHDTLPCPLLDPPAAVLCRVPGTDLEAFDWRDPAAAALARTTCDADRSAIVDYGGNAYVSGVFFDALAERLTAAVKDDDA